MSAAEKMVATHPERTAPGGELTVARAADGKIRIAEAAAFLGVSKDYVYRKSAAGLIPSYKVGKKLEFKEQELIEYRESCKRGGAK